MKVKFIFYGVLKRYSHSENGEENLSVSEGTKVNSILDKYGIIPGELALILINSNLSKENSILKNGDIVKLFPICGGG